MTPRIQLFSFLGVNHVTPCYCANCKTDLTTSSISDAKTAWCPRCKGPVEISCFQVPTWIIGVVIFLASGACFGLWA